MTKSIRALVAAIVAASCITTDAWAQVAPQSADPINRRIDSLVNAALGGPVAAMSVVVVKGRDTLLTKGYGMADIENDVAATPLTVYRIGSITKQFTSAAVMQLVEAGKINLDDDITKYLPNAPTHGRKVLVRHLLNHTSGIPSYTDVGARFGRVMRLDLTHDSLVAVIANDSLMFEPGTTFYYNNTGYFLLGMLLEKVTGKPYGTYLQEKLFTPLGLTGTTYCGTRPIIKHRAQGYDVARGQLVNTDFISMDLPYAAGSLCSTVGDLARWTAALASGRVVSPASYRQMTTPVKLPTGRAMSYGFGLFADSLASHRVISHGGGINGFISQLAYYPDDTLIVAVLANTSPAPSGEVATNIARIVLGMPPVAAPPPPKDLATTPELRAKVVGTYALKNPDGTTRNVEIVDSAGVLQLRTEGQPHARLMFQGETTFAIAGMPGARLRFDVKGARAEGFQFDRGGRPLEAVRR